MQRKFFIVFALIMGGLFSSCHFNDELADLKQKSGEANLILLFSDENPDVQGARKITSCNLSNVDLSALNWTIEFRNVAGNTVQPEKQEVENGNYIFKIAEGTYCITATALLPEADDKIHVLYGEEKVEIGSTGVQVKINVGLKKTDSGKGSLGLVTVECSGFDVEDAQNIIEAKASLINANNNQDVIPVLSDFRVDGTSVYFGVSYASSIKSGFYYLDLSYITRYGLEIPVIVFDPVIEIADNDTLVATVKALNPNLHKVLYVTNTNDEESNANNGLTSKYGKYVVKACNDLKSDTKWLTATLYSDEKLEIDSSNMNFDVIGNSGNLVRKVLVCDVDDNGSQRKTYFSSAGKKDYTDDDSNPELQPPVNEVTMKSTAEIGDIALSNGKFVAKEDYTRVSGSVEAVGVVCNVNDDGTSGLIFGLNNNGDTELPWVAKKNPNDTDYPVAYHYDLVNISGTNTEGDKDGSDNWDYICVQDPEGTAEAEVCYPAFNYALTYGSENNLTGDFSEGWYIPTAYEMYNYVYLNYSAIESAIGTIGGATLKVSYATSSQNESKPERIWGISLNNGNCEPYEKTANLSVGVVHKFGNNTERVISYSRFVKINGEGVYNAVGNGNFTSDKIPVTNIKSFYMAETETTYNKWYEVYNWAVNNGYTFQNLGREGASGTGYSMDSSAVDGALPTSGKNQPVVGVSFRDAVVWCNALSEMEGLKPVYYYNGEVLQIAENCIGDDGSLKGTNKANTVTAVAGKAKAENAEIDETANGYRLPTSAEWEYAARGGKPSNVTTDPWNYTYPGTNDNPEDYIVYGASATADVKPKKPNSAGLYDMTGNVWEWTYEQIASDNTYRNEYGGCYNSQVTSCGVDYKSSVYGYTCRKTIGFRVVRSALETN